jgi:hypothetical protein
MLKDTDRIALYFNLPMDIIKGEIVPELFFERDLKTAPVKGINYLNELLQ